MLIVVLLWAVLLSDSSDSIKRDFEKEGQNKSPANFSFSPSQRVGEQPWQVILDGGNRVLARRFHKGTERHVALAIIEQTDYSNVSIVARIKARSGDRDQNGGLVWRYKDPKNYLLARLDVEDDRVRLYRIVNGNRVRFGEESDVRLRDDTWYTLRIEHSGDKVKVYLDDEAVIVERDKHFSKKSGRVGLYVNENAETYFDEIEVRPLDDK